MKKASYIFGIMKGHLHSPTFVGICRINQSDFTRIRFLTCQVLVLFILNLLKKSIPKELISFSENCNTPKVSRSAVTQARSKLSPKGFIYLNDILVQEFYSDNDIRTFHGLIPLAIDGSLLTLPINSSELLEHYGCATNQTEIQVPMARASHIYDVLHGITIHATMAPYNTGERELAIMHIEKLKTLLSPEILQKIVIIFDRGYPSVPLIIYLIKNGINFLMRSNTKFMKEVDDAVAKGCKDKIISFSAKRTGAAKLLLQKLFPQLDEKEKFNIRIITVNLPSGEKEILITSLLERQKYPYKIFYHLYFQRWGAEENYKFLKIPQEIENFSGMSCLAVEQDFYATVLATNARSLLALEASNEIMETNDSSKGKQNKYIYKINKSVSMEGLKHKFVESLLDPKADIEQFCIKVKHTMKRNLIPIRPGRQYKRIRKHPHRKYHMNLR